MTSITPKAENWTQGVVLGCLGMLGFSGTLVATRVAVFDFSPATITCARIVIAGMLGLGFLAATKQFKLPEKRLIGGIILMGLGLAVGYPFFLALALKSVPSVHGAVVTGLAPAATAIMYVARGGERQTLTFWVACAVGFTGVLYFAFDAGGGHLSLADGWLFLGLVCVAFAYAEGGRISGELGGAVTLSWAMVFLMPAALVGLILTTRALDLTSVQCTSWIAVAYLGGISMFLASVFWYRGLAAGGVARIGQINLLLPLVALGLAALILNEEVTPTAIVCAVTVFGAMLVCLKSRKAT